MPVTRPRPTDLSTTELPTGDLPAPVRQLIAVPPPPETPAAPAAPPVSVTPLPPRTADAGPVEAHARRFLAVLLETVAGRRPLGQLTAWASYGVLAQVHDWLSRRDRVHLVPASVHVRDVHDTGVEVAVRLEAATRRAGGAPRSVALALRFDRMGGRWVCSAVDAGPMAFESVTGVLRPVTAAA